MGSNIHSSDLQDILAQAAAGDESANNALYQLYSDRLMKMLRLRIDPRLNGRVGTEDLLQETWIVACRRLTEYINDPPMSFYLWLRLPATQIYQSERSHRGESPACFDASYQPTGEPFHAKAGSLEHWLTARYCLYSADRQGRLYRGEIDHAPWKLSQASCQLRQNSMCQPLGVQLICQPHLLFAQPIQVRAWLARRCG